MAASLTNERTTAPDETGPALRIYDRVPHGHIAFAVPDDGCLPLLRCGEVAVVEDAPRTFPEDGAWYLFQWIREPRHEWERETILQSIGVACRGKRGHWYNRAPTPRIVGAVSSADGPYPDECAMAENIRGRVVGIYRPG
ncbi:hypothetical protein AAJ72_10000 [Citromicrobium sp. RCC1885]|uniref:hypothetical protein n=1 Tax=unclassified Citromicrobium TaxID=2630544 RepID=UPI0006C9331D|nr:MULTISPECIES: hypothetical protein [unclassified Citromicrobium]KPM23228.1 hypothetical protein AAJ72_10000 [Citromicrobium sp. RCC1885]KPM26635.1 hypothetical protein AAJ74_10740 [Citromicrobium sp. RCC1878]OAM08848.1 hypothetical protein A0U43_09565 [Citromicrobium sp. RCC1897]|tara:strand:+ start:5161 stop:5580 length:420 start_codon:yes stop_codon:yes gene_type:complete